MPGLHIDLDAFNLQRGMRVAIGGADEQVILAVLVRDPATEQVVVRVGEPTGERLIILDYCSRIWVNGFALPDQDDDDLQEPNCNFGTDHQGLWAYQAPDAQLADDQSPFGGDQTADVLIGAYGSPDVKGQPVIGDLIGRAN